MLRRLTYLHSIGCGCLLQRPELVAYSCIAAADLQPELSVHFAHHSCCGYYYDIAACMKSNRVQLTWKVMEKSWKMMIMSWNFYYCTEQFCKIDTTSFIKSNYEPFYLFNNGTTSRWNCHY